MFDSSNDNALDRLSNERKSAGMDLIDCSRRCAVEAARLNAEIDALEQIADKVLGATLRRSPTTRTKGGEEDLAVILEKEVSEADMTIVGGLRTAVLRILPEVIQFHHVLDEWRFRHNMLRNAMQTLARAEGGDYWEKRAGKEWEATIMPFLCECERNYVPVWDRKNRLGNRIRRIFQLRKEFQHHLTEDCIKALNLMEYQIPSHFPREKRS